MACSPPGDDTESSQKQLLVYCGITMIKPMTEIARFIEREQDCEITLTQGGSEDLYQSLKTAQRGDLYLPGSASYRERHLDEGLLGDFVTVGYNQSAMLVAKGNPKAVTADVNELLRDDLAVVICNPESGSIGRETKRLLSKAGIYDAVFAKAAYLTTDSRNLNNALKTGQADVILNWRATAFFEDNAPFMDVIDLPQELAQPKKLVLNLLTFSSHPSIARRLMEYAAGPDGQAIFRRYGFVDNSVELP
jgi:molybdate transport system substrate-binding protein